MHIYRIVTYIVNHYNNIIIITPGRKVIENETVRILWDFHVQTDKNIEHCRPDILIINKCEEEAIIIIDIAVPGDTEIIDREQDKILAYQDLKYEMKRCWGLRKVKVSSVVVRAPGTVS